MEISIAQDFDPNFRVQTSAEYKKFTTALINEVTIFCELSMSVQVEVPERLKICTKQSLVVWDMCTWTIGFITNLVYRNQIKKRR